MGTVSGTIRIKTITSFLPFTYRRFIDKAHSSSDGLHFFKTNNVFYKPPKRKPKKSNLESGGATEYIPPLFLFSDQETPCPERQHEHGRRSEVGHNQTGKLFPKGHDAKQCQLSFWKCKYRVFGLK
jgi:hypothetical protein